MSENTSRIELCLEGAWTTGEAADRSDYLAGEFPRLACSAEAGIDLAGITHLDACGCQLLAVLLENLRRRGVAAHYRGIVPELLDQIRLLGFAPLLCGAEAQGEQPA